MVKKEFAKKNREQKQNPKLSNGGVEAREQERKKWSDLRFG